MEHSLTKFPIEAGKVIEMVVPSRKTRIVTKRGIEHIVLKVEDILLFYTENKIIYILDRFKTKYMYDKSLSELEATLNPELFFRANRKYILNINYIRSYKTFENVKLMVEFILPGIEQKVIISQETAPEFRKWVAGA